MKFNLVLSENFSSKLFGLATSENMFNRWCEVDGGGGGVYFNVSMIKL